MGEETRQVVVGKEPVRGSGNNGKADAKAQPPKTEPATPPAKRETSKTETPSGNPKAEAPKQKALPLRYTVQVLASPQTVPTSSARFKSYRGKGETI